MQRVHVVTSFLLRRDGPSDRVLLLRRSRSVGTHHGLWAGVRGYLERGPEEQAMSEILEETGLESADVEMLERGETVEVEDTENDLVWAVQPFLLIVKHPDKVRLDWEHTESRWVEPRAVRRYRTVPELEEALARVYPPPLAADVEGAISAIRQDVRHGAGQLAREAAKTLALAAQTSMAATVEAFLRDLYRVTVALNEARPSMAAIGNIAAVIEEEISSITGASVAEFKERTAQIAEGWRLRSEESMNKIAENAEHLVKGVILTNSYSSTVLRALLRNKERIDRVVVCESRPGLEGRATVRELAADGVDARLTTDALAISMVADADAVIVGADAVTTSGVVVNKAGTYGLALAARDRGVPFYVLADTLKIWPRKGAPPLETRPGSELWPEATDVEAVNTIFDVTPARLVAGYVTEGGCVNRRQFAAAARKLAVIRKRLRR